jgi:6-phosphogluconolactonase/glucosamine-6-phosphate isomerase/deaminase
MTLTFPTINRSRLVLWLVTGGEKAGMLARLWTTDMSIPAGHVLSDRSLVLADRAAATQVDKKFEDTGGLRVLMFNNHRILTRLRAAQ